MEPASLRAPGIDAVGGSSKALLAEESLKIRGRPTDDSGHRRLTLAI